MSKGAFSDRLAAAMHEDDVVTIASGGDNDWKITVKRKHSDFGDLEADVCIDWDKTSSGALINAIEDNCTFLTKLVAAMEKAQTGQSDET